MLYTVNKNNDSECISQSIIIQDKCVIHCMLIGAEPTPSPNSSTGLQPLAQGQHGGRVVLFL